MFSFFLVVCSVLVKMELAAKGYHDGGGQGNASRLGISVGSSKSDDIPSDKNVLLF